MQESDGFPENIAILAKTVFNCGFAYVKAEETPDNLLNESDREAINIGRAFNQEAEIGCFVVYDAVYHPQFRDLPCVINAPYLRFFAEYRIENPHTGTCSLYIADIAPRTFFSLRERDILKSLTQLIIETMERRIENANNLNAVSVG